MTTILDNIIAQKKREIKEREKILQYGDIVRIYEEMQITNNISSYNRTHLYNSLGIKISSYKDKNISLRKSILSKETAIIAEFKRKSPSRPEINTKARIEEIIPRYETGGAAGCSILADNHYFGGSYHDIYKACRILRNTPILFKEFVIDEYQIYEARLIGADAILLIASALDQKACRQLIDKAHSIGLETILEIHNADELEYISSSPDIVGINNRNLKTFVTDIRTSEELVEKTIPLCKGDIIPISESGIHSPEDIIALKKAGIRGFLIGEYLMTSPSPETKLRQLIEKCNERTDKEI